MNKFDNKVAAFLGEIAFARSVDGAPQSKAGDSRLIIPEPASCAESFLKVMEDVFKGCSESFGLQDDLIRLGFDAVWSAIRDKQLLG